MHAGLTIQLLINPDAEDVGWAARPAAPPKEQLPDVNVTDDIFAIRRAFEEAERLGTRAGSSTDEEGAKLR